MAIEKNLLTSAIIFAIPQDNPKTTIPNNCRFDACIVISSDVLIDESVYQGAIPGGTYLIYKVKHTADAIKKAYSDIFTSLQSNGYGLDHKPIMEKYMGDMISNPYCEICVPIKA